ncbi:F0F1 ATP synthase subunit B [Pedosphaera parvula]|uniref:ATP synthase subunit b n=1 Tax=Pedosphaera parvula (strain Ellin514) TaxID=320771 RepID=B9XPF1_PEDPL|nr:F0F1 ATP synthase subunit B [Pedosphaera parvula]EEF58291.1 ATP synthase F0, B subunit [Pedosphaera parvula Ellin514]
MNHLLILAAAQGNPFEDIAKQFGFNWPSFIAQVISFLIVAGLLYKFAYQPILKILDERRKRIEESLANAEKIKAEVASTEVARQEILAKANTQANKLIEEARAAANKVRETETQKAIGEAAQIIAKAREATVAERAAEMAKLRREVGQLVVRTTAQVTGKILTPEDQKRLVDDTNKQLAA